MNTHIANALNPLLAIFGRKIIRSYIGHWYVDINDGEIKRKSYPIGWRLAPRAQYEGVPEGATELDRFVAAHKEQIAQKRAARR